MSPIQASESDVLAKKIAGFQVQLTNMLPAETMQALNAEIAAMVAQDPGTQALQAGALAPLFTLPNAAGGKLSLAAVLATGPAVVTFYRGSWCPYCDLQLRAYADILPQIEAAGAKLIAISPQTPEHSVSTAEKAALKFAVLSDVDNKTARDFGLVYKVASGMAGIMRGFGIDLNAVNGDSSWELPVTGTFIVGTDRKIHYAWVDADYRHRLEPAELLRRLAGVSAAWLAKTA
jgi:peroxiredoxin